MAPPTPPTRPLFGFTVGTSARGVVAQNLFRRRCRSVGGELKPKQSWNPGARAGARLVGGRGARCAIICTDGRRLVCCQFPTPQSRGAEGLSAAGDTCFALMSNQASVLLGGRGRIDSVSELYDCMEALSPPPPSACKQPVWVSKPRKDCILSTERFTCHSVSSNTPVRHRCALLTCLLDYYIFFKVELYSKML